MYCDFLHHLRKDLQGPLPGLEVQYNMAPSPLSGSRLPYDQPTADARRSGVLILLYPHQGELHIPLILRPTTQGVHSGQISFPGGGYEPGDEDMTQTALREAYEEIGVTPATLQILGSLTPLYIFVSNNMVYPILAWSEQRPNFVANPGEVAQLLEMPIHQLRSPQNRHTELWQLRDRQAHVPFFEVHGHRIWGATAMMLGELFALPTLQQMG